MRWQTMGSRRCRRHCLWCQWQRNVQTLEWISMADAFEFRLWLRPDAQYGPEEQSLWESRRRSHVVVAIVVGRKTLLIIHLDAQKPTHVVQNWGENKAHRSHSESEAVVNRFRLHHFAIASTPGIGSPEKSIPRSTFIGAHRLFVFSRYVRATHSQKYEYSDGHVHWMCCSTASAARNNNNLFVFVFTALTASHCLSEMSSAGSKSTERMPSSRSDAAVLRRPWIR